MHEHDKRRWTTLEQRTFLDGYVQRYLEAQAGRGYPKFWARLFQDWFAEFPVAEPTEDDPTDSESEPDTDSERGSDALGDAGTKRKRSRGKKSAKKRVRKVIYLSYRISISY